MQHWEKLRQSEINNILVIRFWSVAEILSATPLVRVLRNCFPHAKIDFLLKETFADLLTGCPFIHEIIPCYGPDHKQGMREIFRLYKKIKRVRYDLIIDIQREKRSALLCLFSRARFRIGYQVSGWIGNVYNMKVQEMPVTRHLVLTYLDLVRGLIGYGKNQPDLTLFVAKGYDNQKGISHDFGNENKKKVLIHPGGKRSVEVWPAEKFAQLAGRLIQENEVEIILAGSYSDVDKKDVDRINSLIKGRGHVFYHSTLSQLISLIQAIDIFIGNDNGPMHIAAALGKHVIALFGPSDPRMRHPWGSGHEVLWSKLPCSPCDYQECPRGRADCMDRIEVSGVLEAVHRFLAE